MHLFALLFDTVLTWVAQVSVQKGQCVWLDVVCCVRDMDKHSDKESISYFTKWGWICLLSVWIDCAGVYKTSGCSLTSRCKHYNQAVAR